VDGFDVFRDLLVLEGSLGFGALLPSVVATFGDVQHSTHDFEVEAVAILGDELKSYLLSFTKNLAAAFKISRS
jgi:hypothetical protein